MLNPLTPAEVVAAIGRAARDGARSDDPTGAFARGQLLSAYSATRHLAAELETFGPEVARFAADVAQAAREAADAAGAGDARPGDAARLAAQLRAAGDAADAAAADAQRLGDVVCELLDVVRADGSPAAAALRTELQTLLAGLADREVALLADAIERQAA